MYTFVIYFTFFFYLDKCIKYFYDSVFFKWEQQNSVTSVLVTMETIDFKCKIVCKSYTKTTLCLSPDLIVMKKGDELSYILLKTFLKLSDFEWFYWPKGQS